MSILNRIVRESLLKVLSAKELKEGRKDRHEGDVQVKTF